MADLVENRMSSFPFLKATLPSNPSGPIAANLHGPDAFRHMVRHMVLGPAWLLLTNMPLLFLLLGMLKKELDSPVWVIAGIYLFRAFVWGLVLIVVFPSWLRFCMSRNLPFLAAYLGLLAAMLVLLTLITAISRPDLDLIFLVSRFVRQFLTGMVLTSALILVSDRSIRSLGADPSLVPVWWPVTIRRQDAPSLPQETEADVSLLDPALSGRIFSIQARNQYVEVQTPEKLHLLRMSFSTALTMLPESAGCQIHRSWWVSHDLPHAVRRNGQNFEVLDSVGRVYPVSRPNLHKVRSLIAKNNPGA